MRRLKRIRAAGLGLALLTIPRLGGAATTSGTLEMGNFRFVYDANGISGLANPNDPFGATLIPAAGPARGAGAAGARRARGARAGQRGGDGGATGTLGGALPAAGAGTLALTLTVTTDPSAAEPAWINVSTRGQRWDARPHQGVITYSNTGGEAPLKVTETFKTDGKVLDWTVALEAAGSAAVRVGDLGINVPVSGPWGEDPIQIFEHGFLRHQFIEGAGSFFYFVRASGAPPFLLVTVKPGTHFEYSGGGGGRGGGGAMVHSALSASRAAMGTWRQPNTSLDLKPAGQPGSKACYGFRLQWANSYDEMRDLIYQEGLFDVRVVPGMTIPDNLTARFSLRTKARIDSIGAEFPDQTRLTKVGEPQPDTHVYEVAFKRLGENMLTINHDGGRKTYLEFFVSEPMETLIKKRAAFIVNKQQIKDPTKWWDGVYGPYDMRAKVTRTIEDPDIFLDRMVYTLTCDDPGLCKAPYLASKNVYFPNQKEIESIEYYLEHFVWGGLQRKDDERPYPYGVYGTPNWYVNRDPERRRAWIQASADPSLRDVDKEHVWRSYDYPHVIMLYYHMYQIAKYYPAMSKYLDAAGYLRRAYETARAFYTYPYEIYPRYYETTKWGLYNELVVLELADALEKENFPERAEWLRKEWEKKTKYFVYDDPYPFRSEYAFDRTAFESTYALAKYGATHDMAPDENLWWDVKLGKWYSHPSVKREDSRAFMDRQLASGLVVRGWLEASYFQLGNDRGVSYMAAMGGWGILDYALNFAPKPYDWLQLGYASYLGSWCLMNTGRPDTNYGFWYPGAENDGASGWQFQSGKVGGAWMGSSSGIPGGLQAPRGPWWYDGEIDLGYGGALRMAATIVTRDPIFGWFAYGGAMKEQGKELSINPRDGLRRRFHVVIPDMYPPFEDGIKRLKLELERDGFAADQNIVMDKALSRIAMTIENRTNDAHATGLRLSIPPHTRFDLLQDGKKLKLGQTGNWDYPWRAELTMGAGPARIELVRTDRAEAAAGRGDRRSGAGGQ